MPEAFFIHLRVGRIANPINPRFGRLGVYFWKDVAALCIATNLEIPE